MKVEMLWVVGSASEQATDTETENMTFAQQICEPCALCLFGLEDDWPGLYNAIMLPRRTNIR